MSVIMHAPTVHVVVVTGNPQQGPSTKTHVNKYIYIYIYIYYHGMYNKTTVTIPGTETLNTLSLGTFGYVGFSRKCRTALLSCRRFNMGGSNN